MKNLEILKMEKIIIFRPGEAKKWFCMNANISLTTVVETHCYEIKLEEQWNASKYQYILKRCKAYGDALSLIILRSNYLILKTSGTKYVLFIRPDYISPCRDKFILPFKRFYCVCKAMYVRFSVQNPLQTAAKTVSCHSVKPDWTISLL